MEGESSGDGAVGYLEPVRRSQGLRSASVVRGLPLSGPCGAARQGLWRLVGGESVSDVEA